RLARLREELVSLDLEPVVLGTSEPLDIDRAFVEWAELRRLRRWARGGGSGSARGPWRREERAWGWVLGPEEERATRLPHRRRAPARDSTGRQSTSATW